MQNNENGEEIEKVLNKLLEENWFFRDKVERMLFSDHHFNSEVGQI
jgi:hypothetical protein